MDLKRITAVSGAGLLTVLASAPGVLATELNTTAIESSFSLIYLFIPIVYQGGSIPKRHVRDMGSNLLDGKNDIVHGIGLVLRNVRQDWKENIDEKSIFLSILSDERKGTSKHPLGGGVTPSHLSSSLSVA